MKQKIPHFSIPPHNATVPSFVVPPLRRGNTASNVKCNLNSWGVCFFLHLPRRKKMEKLKFSRGLEWWQSVMIPVRRVWIGIATRFEIRKTGLMKLQHDVRACEYEDIRVMWEMLNRNESDFGNSPRKIKKRNYWKLLKWARCAPYICRT